MTAVLPSTSSPTASTSPLSPQSTNPNHPPLTPLITSSPMRRGTAGLQRPLSHASRNRLSQYSNTSGPSRSRPPSHVFPAFHSSLSYTTVRDFAYTVLHPLHYGPPPEPSQPLSGTSTPASEFDKRLSDPPASWDSRGSWGSEPWGPKEGLNKGEQLPPIHFGDGPPWSEDEDLQSPVVVSSRHKKHKSSSGTFGSGPGRGRARSSRDESERNLDQLSSNNFEQGRTFYAGPNGDGNEGYYMDQDDEASGLPRDFVVHPPDPVRHSGLAPYNSVGQRDSHFAGTLLPNRSYTDGDPHEYRSDSDVSSRESSPGLPHRDESRYSRNYQFTIASPDEEMHGKAVALFDFQRENENELPLVEGQVIWVSYRHGQGWLVAEDPKTHESGLVPEEYVRLLRDIQGGLHSLTGQIDVLSPGGADSGTPTQADHGQPFSHAPAASNGSNSNGYQQPILSTFSTSSKDLHPYPQHLLGTQAGMAPPQVIHYHGQRGGSQANTPTMASSHEGTLGGRRYSEDVRTPLEGSMGSNDKANMDAHAEEHGPGSPMDEDSPDDEDEDSDEE